MIILVGYASSSIDDWNWLFSNKKKPTMYSRMVRYSECSIVVVE